MLLTRILSAALAYHFGFLAISLALLGVGVGALAVYLRPGWFEAPLEALLARWSVVLALLLLVVPAALVRLDFVDRRGRHASPPRFALTLALTCVLAALPFAAAGVVVALAVRGWAAAIGRVYAFDLAGAGLGALVVVPLMWIASAPTLAVGLAVVAAIAALLFGGAPRARGRGPGGVPPRRWRWPAGRRSTTLPPTVGPQGVEPVSDRWTPLSRVLGYAPPEGSRFALLFYDRIYAPVPVRTGPTSCPDWSDLRLGPQSVAYALRPGGRALVIGGGGGRDIENALSAGQRRVDVIELNRAIRETVDDDLRAYSGAPYSLPGVDAEDGDGRSQLAARDTRYDVIHIGFTDTLSAASAQGFALSEANLYTVEAFREYLDHLEPGGVLAVTRLHRLVGDEALRTTVLALEALERDGVAEPERGVAVLLGRDIFGELFGTVLARREPWTPDGARPDRAPRGRARRGRRVRPRRPVPARVGAARAAPRARSAFCEGYRLDVCPPTDDRPFFFNMKRAGDVFSAPPPGYFYAVDPLLVLALALGHPGRAVRDRLRAAAGARAGAAAAHGDDVLRRHRRRLPAVRDRADPALHAVPRLPDLRALGRAVLAAGVHRARLAGVGPRARAAARARRRAGRRLRADRGRRVRAPAAAGGADRAAVPVRVALTAALIAPPALLLGTAMPIGLARLRGLHANAVPWAWAINGVSSVLASVLAVAVAITWGFRVVTLLALACYLVALAHALRGRWPTGA